MKVLHSRASKDFSFAFELGLDFFPNFKGVVPPPVRGPVTTLQLNRGPPLRKSLRRYVENGVSVRPRGRQTPGSETVRSHRIFCPPE